MIRLDLRDASPDVRWAVDLLVDLAALLPVDDPEADVATVQLRTHRGPVATVAAARAAGWGVLDADPTSGRITLDADVLRLLARVAAASDEQQSGAEDRHGRVPSDVNQLVREAEERRPVLHEAARAFLDAVERAAGGRPVRRLAPWPDGRAWAAALTHDLDVVAGWPAFAALRWIELARRGYAGLAARALGSAVRAAMGSPVAAGVEEILAVEARHEIRATWFILCGTPSWQTVRTGDLTYRPESAAARRILGRVADGGHEFGLHGSFATGLDARLLGAQRRRLGELTGAPIHGVRQHFLRMRPGRTQREMATAGFAFDATFGYPDRNGFRLGTADVLPDFLDATEERTRSLAVVPLVWMDRALSKYRGVESPDAWIADAFALAEVVRGVGGLWTGLWHPNLTPALGYPGAPAAFARLVAGLAAERPFVAPLGELVAWRAARRAVRVRSLSGDSGPIPSHVVDARVRVLDAAGRPDDRLTSALLGHVGSTATGADS